jgi:hypothetical protein
MKFQIKYFMLLLATIVAGGAFISCSSDDENRGEPNINYIRVTDPVSSDSLIVKAGQGQLIAIMGENLGDVREVWLNDQQAQVELTYVTNTSILARLPQILPEEVTNTLSLVFANKDTLTHPFTLDVSKPFVDYMLSEYVKTGEIAIIRGDYFYEPVTVTFTGGVEGEVVEVEQDAIQVRVPDGAQPGPVMVESNFGITESDFHFRDSRNMILTFDGSTEGWAKGADLIVESDPDIENIDGSFLRFDQVIGSWQWYEVLVANTGSGITTETKNIPEAAFANPAAYALKFEINTLESTAGAEIRIFMGPDVYSRGEASYIWTPNFHTEGEWETVSIPFEEFYNENEQFSYDGDGYGLFLYFLGPNEVDANFAIDNLRVVPN